MKGKEKISYANAYWHLRGQLKTFTNIYVHSICLFISLYNWFFSYWWLQMAIFTVTGWLYDLTLDFDISFYLASMLGGMSVLLACIAGWRMRRTIKNHLIMEENVWWWKQHVLFIVHEQIKYLWQCLMFLTQWIMSAHIYVRPTWHMIVTLFKEVFHVLMHLMTNKTYNNLEPRFCMSELSHIQWHIILHLSLFIWSAEHQLRMARSIIALDASLHTLTHVHHYLTTTNFHTSIIEQFV